MDINVKLPTSWWPLIVCFVLGAILGFWLGRKTIVTGEKETVVAGAEIGETRATGTPELIVDSLASSRLPVKRDTIRIEGQTITVVESVDTAAIIADYELKRRYTEILFSNQYGKLDINFNVQYNKVDSIKWSYIPLQSVKIVTQEKTFTPFLMAGYSTMGITSLGGGAFWYKWGIGYQYQKRFLTGETGHNIVGFYRF